MVVVVGGLIAGRGWMVAGGPTHEGEHSILTVLFQRPGDIVVGVRTGSIDFGVAGSDVIDERRGGGRRRARNGSIVMRNGMGAGVSLRATESL